MFHLLAFLSKSPLLSHGEFKDYYENRHLPLIKSLSGNTLPQIYKRRYIHHEEEDVILKAANGDAADFDVVTELVFQNREAYQAWGAQISKDGGWDKIVEDESKFLDRSRTRSHVVDECVTCQ